jgi:hypothetical protein
MFENRASRAAKLKKIGLYAVVAVALTVSVAGVVVARHWPFSQKRIAQSLQGTFPATVNFQKFRPTYFPHPGCVAEGLAFRWLGSSPQAPPIVTIQRLTIEAQYIDLLLRPGYLARVVLDGFRLRIPSIGTPREQYVWRADESNTRVGELIADGSTIEIARSSFPLRFRIQTAKLNSVSRNEPMSYEISLRNPLPPGEIRAHGQFGPWNSKEPGETSVAGEYLFQDADLGVFKGIGGTLSSEDKFHGPLKHIETQGSIDIPNFRVTRSVHSVHLKGDFRAFVDGTNGDVKLERVNASFLRTRVLGKGEIAATAGQHGKTASVDLTVTNGRIQDVFLLFVREPKSPLNGTTSFRAHVVIPPGKRPFLQKVRLDGDFGIAEGQFEKKSTQSTVNNFSEKARGEKPEAGSEDTDTAVSNLSGHVELRDAIAHFSNFSFVVPGASAEMQGTYHLQTRAVDLHGTMKSNAELSKMNSGLKSVLLKPFDFFFKKKHAGAVVPVHLIGTYDDPRPGVDIPSKKSSSPNQPSTAN